MSIESLRQIVDMVIESLGRTKNIDLVLKNFDAESDSKSVIMDFAYKHYIHRGFILHDTYPITLKADKEILAKGEETESKKLEFAKTIMLGLYRRVEAIERDIRKKG